MMTDAAAEAMHLLARAPRGIATLSRADLHSLLLETGGTIISKGQVVEIASKHIGAGVYQVTVREAGR